MKHLSILFLIFILLVQTVNVRNANADDLSIQKSLITSAVANEQSCELNLSEKSSPLQEINEFIKKVNPLAKVAVILAIDLILGYVIHKLAQKSGKALAEYVPELFAKISMNLGIAPSFADSKSEDVLSFIMTKILKLDEKFSSKSDLISYNLRASVIAPMMEEFVFRYFLQEFLLKRVPKAVLKKYFPTQTDLIDSTFAKSIRVGTSSLSFALAHPVAYLSGAGGGFSQLLSGMIYGNIVEKNKGDISKSIVQHALLNTVLSILPLLKKN